MRPIWRRVDRVKRAISSRAYRQADGDRPLVRGRESGILTVYGRLLMSRRLVLNCFVRLMAGGLALLSGGVGEVRADNEVQKLTSSDAADGQDPRSLLHRSVSIG